MAQELRKVDFREVQERQERLGAEPHALEVVHLPIPLKEVTKGGQFISTTWGLPGSTPTGGYFAPTLCQSDFGQPHQTIRDVGVE